MFHSIFLKTIMQFPILVRILVISDFTYIASGAENLFSPDLSQPISDVDLFTSGELTPLLNSNVNEPISGFTEEDVKMDTLADNSGTFIPLENLNIADGLVDPNLLQSSCQTEGSVMDDALQARDTSCPPNGGKESIAVPDLFRDPEAGWPRFLPQKKKASSEPQGLTALDSLLNFLGLGEGTRCPPDYPIRCCSDFLSGWSYFFDARPLYYIHPFDCSASELSVPFLSC